MKSLVKNLLIFSTLLCASSVFAASKIDLTNSQAKRIFNHLPIESQIEDSINLGNSAYGIKLTRSDEETRCTNTVIVVENSYGDSMSQTDNTECFNRYVRLALANNNAQAIFIALPKDSETKALTSLGVALYGLEYIRRGDNLICKKVVLELDDDTIEEITNCFIKIVSNEI